MHGGAETSSTRVTATAGSSSHHVTYFQCHLYHIIFVPILKIPPAQDLLLATISDRSMEAIVMSVPSTGHVNLWYLQSHKKSYGEHGNFLGGQIVGGLHEATANGGAPLLDQRNKH